MTLKRGRVKITGLGDRLPSRVVAAGEWIYTGERVEIMDNGQLRAYRGGTPWGWNMGDAVYGDGRTVLLRCYGAVSHRTVE